MSPATGTAVGARELAALLGQPAPSDEQAAVIEEPLRPGLVVAGAGSGKTETMAARVVWLVANGLVRPEQVLGLTFTRKAAGELAARIGHRIRQLAAARVVAEEVVLAGEPTVSTYHAYAARLVAEHGVRLGVEPTSRLLTDAVRWQYAARVVQAYDGDMSHITMTPASLTAELLDLADEMGEHFVVPEELRGHTERLVRAVEGLPDSSRKAGVYRDVRRVLDRQLARLQLLPLVEQYSRSKRLAEAMDYGDQMGVAARLARDVPEIGASERRRYAAVLLDEYQDTSHSQLVLLRSLYAEGHPVTAVGDPCQSIYGWRGASSGSLQRFPEHFALADGTLLPQPAAVQELSTSWRNDGRILDLANAVAGSLRTHGAVVPVLHPVPGREQAGQVRCALVETADDEAQWIAARLAHVWAEQPGRTAAVLTRRRSQQRVLETALRSRGVPVEVLGLGGLLDTPEVRDVVSTLRVAVDPSAGDALLRLLSGARWRLGPRDLAALGRRARHLVADQSVSGTSQPSRPVARPGAPSETVAGPGEQPARSDREDDGSVVDALDDLGQPAAYSAPGWQRLAALRDELRALRRRLDQPLPDLVSDIEQTIGLDVEVAVRRPEDQALARGHLDAFLDIAADFAADLAADSAVAGGSLTAFLSYLQAAEDKERGLEAGVVERRSDVVQILTVHGAKGLEWDVVAIPGLVKGVFPSADAGGDVWTTKLGAVPYPLRGDRAELPQWEAAACADQKDADSTRRAFLQRCADIGVLEERRLAYVAITRARSELLCSGYWWDDALGARGPSPLLEEVRAHLGDAVEHWEQPPDRGAINPRRADIRTAIWPFDPLGARRGAVDDAAVRVRAAGPPDTLSEWHGDVELLLAERAAEAPAAEDVAVPAHLSVSQLVTLGRDPQRLAAQLRRPMPFAPAPLARRGTAFHAWLEHRFGAQRLIDLDELPGAEDAGAEDGELAALQEAFLASAWADRTPVEVEVPFELRLGELSVRGRMDAVFLDEHGRYDVVDWKTGQVPTGNRAEETAVQLAAYRLAWADLSGVRPDRVGAAFHYVRHNRTVRPADLLDAAGLGALLQGLPVAGSAP